jgi:hypothetical protein
MARTGKRYRNQLEEEENGNLELAVRQLALDLNNFDTPIYWGEGTTLLLHRTNSQQVEVTVTKIPFTTISEPHHSRLR